MTKVDFEQIYDQYYQVIFNYCLRRTGDFDLSRDITSETFLKAYLSYHRFKYRGVPVVNWLYRIAGNEIKLSYRARKYQARLVRKIYLDNPYPPHQELQVEKEQAQKEIENHKRFIQVQQAIQQLPMKYQEVISLKYFEQLTITEISMVLDKKQGTIKSLLSRGMKRLRQLL